MQRISNLAYVILAGVVALGLTPLMVVVDAQARIVFASDRDGLVIDGLRANEIYVMDADGGNQHRLTNHPKADGLPSWSPDGERIAFSYDTRGDLESFEIYVIDADGGNQRRLTNNLGDNDYPSWSSDGKHIVFTSRRDGNSEIYVMDADGGNQQNLTNNPHGDVNPAWFDHAFSVAPAGKTLTMWGWLKQVDQ